MEADMIDKTLPGHVLGQAWTQGSNGEESKHLPGGLRETLAELGHKLVAKYGFSAADLQGCSSYVNRTTEPLVRFLIWLQHTPEAGAVLRDMGVWQDNIEESTEVELNSGTRPSPTLSRPRWPRNRNSVA
jgi:hypothetical protein